eukprot:1386752-Amorphochlora_amoeboformis.AAC.1
MAGRAEGNGLESEDGEHGPLKYFVTLECHVVVTISHGRVSRYVTLSRCIVTLHARFISDPTHAQVFGCYGVRSSGTSPSPLSSYPSLFPYPPPPLEFFQIFQIFPRKIVKKTSIHPLIRKVVAKAARSIARASYSARSRGIRALHNGFNIIFFLFFGLRGKRARDRGGIHAPEELDMKLSNLTEELDMKMSNSWSSTICATYMRSRL